MHAHMVLHLYCDCTTVIFGRLPGVDAQVYKVTNSLRLETITNILTGNEVTSDKFIPPPRDFE